MKKITKENKKETGESCHVKNWKHNGEHAVELQRNSIKNSPINVREKIIKSCTDSVRWDVQYSKRNMKWNNDVVYQ